MREKLIATSTKKFDRGKVSFPTYIHRNKIESLELRLRNREIKKKKEKDITTSLCLR